MTQSQSADAAVSQHTEKKLPVAGYYRFAVGDIRLLMLHDVYSNTMPMGPADIIVNVPAQEIEGAVTTHFLSAALQVSPLLIDTGRERILVDAGLGTHVPGMQGKLLTSLQQAGFSPTDIDVVIVTHLHVDHIGGLMTREGELVFSRARHIISQVEWNWATTFDFSQLPQPVRERLEPMIARFRDVFTGRLDVVNDGDEIVPGVYALLTPGHTPGHLALRVTSQNETLLHLADTIARQISIYHPDWHLRMDFDPAQAVQTRHQLLRRIASERLLMSAYHLPWPNLGHIRETTSGYEWVPLEWNWAAQEQ